jgi:hypothetical protein
VGFSDVGAFLTQLPFKENAVLERIVRGISVPVGTGAICRAWDSSWPGMPAGSSDGKIDAQTDPLRCRNLASNDGHASLFRKIEILKISTPCSIRNNARRRLME